MSEYNKKGKTPTNVDKDRDADTLKGYDFSAEKGLSDTTVEGRGVKEKPSIAAGECYAEKQSIEDNTASLSKSSMLMHDHRGAKMPFWKRTMMKKRSYHTKHLATTMNQRVMKRSV